MQSSLAETRSLAETLGFLWSNMHGTRCRGHLARLIWFYPPARVRKPALSRFLQILKSNQKSKTIDSGSLTVRNKETAWPLGSLSTRPGSQQVPCYQSS